MKSCEKCGASIDENVKFCPLCGAPQEDRMAAEADPVQEMHPAAELQQPETPPDAQENRKKLESLREQLAWFGEALSGIAA